MVEWRTPMRSARSRFDDQEYFARTQPSDISTVRATVNVFITLAWFTFICAFGWAAAYGVYKLIQAICKAVIG